MAMAFSTSQAIDLDEGRWPPGSIVADRYRILGLLGKGGMGEVYRASDQRLGQTVALKFLPETFSRDPSMLARFYNEVRIARQVTHPNVCRVFDIGEADGQPFLSMQFIDGENLASLLLRIGRLPPDKAVEISRKLCAGLAAAHAQNVLHRDLKPANIMLDNRGQVVITDFGLAGLAEDFRGADIGSGTPAYMSPEQLAGKEVTFKSDIYALGLVLYEIFTGRPAFEAETLADMIRLRQESRPAEISTMVREIDPSVEKAILRCLDPEPANRPASALAVSAALPGGDPLAAALAAGETPTPEMVAAAGSKQALKPVIAAAMLALILALLPTVPLFHGRFMLLGKINLELPPEALLVQAHKTLQQIGYGQNPVDSAWGLDYNEDLDNYEKYQKGRGSKADYSAAALNQMAPIVFSYRQSPKPLVARGFPNLGFIRPNDPPAILSGMAFLRLDMQGRLVKFYVLPPQQNSSPTSATAGDPANLFAAAGLDFQTFQPAPSLWAAPVASDARTAWTGPFPGLPGNTLRVEAAWWNGRPVWFELIPPWAKANRMVTPDSSSSVASYFEVAQVLIFLLGASLLAWRNLRLGRGDRQGAFRLAAFIFVVVFGDVLLMAHRLFSSDGVSLLGPAAAKALWTAARLWLAYLALEPAVRRRWPRILISWSRIASGKWQDPVVGRDVLVGVIVGLGYALILMAALGIAIYRSPEAFPDSGTNLGTLLGFRYGLDHVLEQITTSVSSGLVLFLLLFIFRLILRNEWLAAVVLTACFAGIQGGQSETAYIMVPAFVLVYGAVFAVLLRFGLVSMMVAIFTVDLLMSFSFTLNFSAWYGTGSFLVLAVVAALALYAFRRSLGNQKLLAGWIE
jgi:Protein kinase domain